MVSPGALLVSYTDGVESEEKKYETAKMSDVSRWRNLDVSRPPELHTSLHSIPL